MADVTGRERDLSPTRTGSSERERSPAAQPANWREGDWMCSSCQAHNYASKVSCHKCGLGKDGTNNQPEGFRDGDWMCKCGAHNYASKIACHKCGISKLLVGVGPNGQQPDNFRSGDWMCNCGAHNYASKSACHKCATPKTVAVGMMGMMGGQGMGMGATPSNFRQGDWMCRCGAHNYASKTNCHKCATPKAQAGGQQMAMGYGMDPYGMGTHTNTDQFGMGMGQGMGMGMGGMGMGGMGMGGMGMGGMGGGMGGMGGMGGGGGGGGGGAPNFRAGDWMCNCGAHNYASKTACHKCSTPKAEADTGAAGPLPSTFRQGDWMCTGCQAHNYASKTACHKCSAPKP